MHIKFIYTCIYVHVMYIHSKGNQCIVFFFLSGTSKEWIFWVEQTKDNLKLRKIYDWEQIAKDDKTSEEFSVWQLMHMELLWLFYQFFRISTGFEYTYIWFTGLTRHWNYSVVHILWLSWRQFTLRTLKAKHVDAHRYASASGEHKCIFWIFF